MPGFCYGYGICKGIEDESRWFAQEHCCVTVGELRSNFKAGEAKPAKGVRVQITRRGEIVAEIQAPTPEAIASGTLPDFEGAYAEDLGGASAG